MGERNSEIKRKTYEKQINNCVPKMLPIDWQINEPDWEEEKNVHQSQWLCSIFGNDLVFYRAHYTNGFSTELQIQCWKITNC